MYKIYITKNPNGDTRTAGSSVTFDEFHDANKSHQADVGRVMIELGELCNKAGERHDITKTIQEKQFYNDFKDVVYGRTDKAFTELPWYQMHVQAERHHLNANCPDDVNLIDVLEMIADCTCAGKTRTGVVYGLDLSDDILRKAFENTVKLVDDITVVSDGDRVPRPVANRYRDDGWRS